MAKRLPLFAFLALVGVLWLIFAQREESREENKVLLFFIGTLFTVCVVLMLVWVEQWHLRAIGVFGAIAGTALLYFLLATPRDGWWRGHTIPEDLIRAFFLSGGLTLAISQFWFVREKRRGSRQRGGMVDHE